MTASDGTLSASDTFTLDITPVNDAPVAVPVDLGSIAEDGSRLVTSAELLAGVSDVDGPPAIITALTLTSGSGTLVDNMDGTWTYTPAPDDDTAATFSYTASDGTASASSTATLDITPVNDPPVNTVPGAQSVDEDTTLPIAGVSVGDIDTSSGIQVSLTVTNGTLTVAAGGGAAISDNGTSAVTLAGTLDQINAALAGLSYLGDLNFNGTDTLTIVSNDSSGGTDTDTIAITVNPVNDAAVITGDIAGDVIEAGGVTNGTPGTSPIGGDLNAADVDDPPDSWNAVDPTPSDSGYGVFLIGADGLWAYALDDENPEVQALNFGDTLIDTFTATTIDGTSQVVTITIEGSNDAPVITAAVDSGEVTEGELPVMTANGTIDFGDVDLSDAHVTSVTPAAGGYLGTLVANVTNDSTGDGVGQVTWLFAADNVLRQSIASGEVLVQTYTVEIDDGHGGTATQLVTITINGTNDAAIITGDTTGTVVEAGGVSNGTPGDPTATGNLGATDVDDPDNTFTVVDTPTPSANGYGSFVININGVWTYTLDNTNPAVQVLNASDTLTDNFTVTTIDGTAQVVTITIEGNNDDAIITGTAAGDVIEAGGVANGAVGTPTATGDLDAADVDNLERHLDCGPCADAERPGLRHLHAERRGRVDLHPRQHQPRRRGAQRRRHADRYLPRHHRRWHVAGRHHHHHRNQRRRGDHRRRQRRS